MLKQLGGLVLWNGCLACMKGYLETSLELAQGVVHLQTRATLVCVPPHCVSNTAASAPLAKCH